MCKSLIYFPQHACSVCVQFQMWESNQTDNFLCERDVKWRLQSRLFLARLVLLLQMLNQRLFVRENVAVPFGHHAFVTHPDLLRHLQPHHNQQIHISIHTAVAHCTGHSRRLVSSLVFNGAFSTNRLYRAVGVRDVSCRSGTRQTYNKTKKRHTKLKAS